MFRKHDDRRKVRDDHGGHEDGLSRSGRREHLAVAHEAGLGRFSLVSVLAGLVCAYGTFAVVAAIVGAVLSAAEVDTEFRTDDWTGSGAAALLGSALALLVAYLFGGYVAGRMARRAGGLHGVAVFVATLIVGAAAGGLVAALTDDAEIRSNLRSIGVPTASSQVTDVAIAGVVASLAAILIGSLLGGVLGERWHTKLSRRVADPSVGMAAQQRSEVAEAEAARQDLIHRDPVLGPEVDLRDPGPTTPLATGPTTAPAVAPPPPPRSAAAAQHVPAGRDGRARG